MKNIAIVGFGAIGTLHAKALSDVKNARLYAVCDIDGDALARVRSAYEDVRLYPDFDEMLLDDTIHAVHICTPHYLHFEMIEKALAAGKEVITEKPLTMTKAELDALLSLENADKICVVFQNRLNPSVVKLKAILEKGDLGKLITAKGILTWHRDLSYYKSAAWRGKLDTEGGGVLINQAIHTLDLMSYLGGNIASVKASAQNFTLPELEVEDTVTALLEFENGARGLFFATNGYGRDDAPTLEFIFENDIFTYRDGKLYQGDAVLADDTGDALGKSCWGAGHRTLLKNYYEKQVFFTPFDVKNTMDTVFAIYESAKTGKSQRASRSIP